MQDITIRKFLSAIGNFNDEWCLQLLYIIIYLQSMHTNLKPSIIMKTIFNTSLLLIFLTLNVPGFSQKECKVLIPELQGEYEGRCKKGLAHGKGEAKGTDTYKGQFKKGLPHGKGTYTWANGDVYIGKWRNGVREGEGKQTYLMAHGVDVKDGIWKEDEYVGPKPKKPKVLSNRSVERYKFEKVGEGNRVLVGLYHAGTDNTDIQDYSIISTSGMDTSLGNQRGYENVTFPVQIKVKFRTWNKLHSARYDVSFEFEIPEPGEWRVSIHN